MRSRVVPGGCLSHLNSLGHWSVNRRDGLSIIALTRTGNSAELHCQPVTQVVRWNTCTKQGGKNMRCAPLTVAITLLLFVGSAYAGGYMQRMPDGSYSDSDGGYYQRMPDGSYSTPDGYMQRMPDGSYSGPGGYYQRMPNGSYSTPNGYMQRMPDGSYSTPGGYMQRMPDGSYSY